jgi:tRNA threonylcarbamoyl adenosine modification protein YeaZ
LSGAVTGGRWLAIDTATDVASVAVGNGATVLAGAHTQGARRHAAEILRLVDFVLSRAGARPGDLDGIVLGDGPGSFTGLRIGWATAKGLAQESGLEVRAVPSLLAAAAGAAARLGAVPIAACFDALRGQVYAGIYVVHPDRAETLLAPSVVTVAELATRSPVRPRLVVGDGAVRYAADVTAWVSAPPVPLDQLPPTATMLLGLVERAGAARVIDDLASAEPVYGRPAEAQARWEARYGRPLPDPSRPAC